MDCSKTIDFMKEKSRMCESVKNPDDCFGKCPLSDYCMNTSSESLMREGIAALQKWSDEHPDNAQQSARWIGVEVRLPEDYRRVLIIASGRPEKGVLLENSIEIADFWAKGDDCAENRWTVETYPDWDDPQVTHWMPLPESPSIE